MRPRVGVSACALGAPVRYNGGGKRHRWITDVFAPHVELVQVCPEEAMGLGTPREALRLVKPEKGSPTLRLTTSNSKEDRTDLARDTVGALLRGLPGDLDGFILQNLSPLCGLEKVKVYDHNDAPSPSGTGFFAAELEAARPDLALTEAGRLHDAAQREAFLLKLYTLARFRTSEPTVAGLQAFHREHKFLLMAHGTLHLGQLGKLAADARAATFAADRASYKAALTTALNVKPTRGRMADALVHMYGFLKDGLGSEEKNELLARIEDYKRGALPLVVPLAVLGFANSRVQSEYLKGQRLFAPYPEML